MPAPRPPYATDEPDAVYYDSNSTNNRRIQQQPPPDPNDRTSAYNLYDDYLYDSASSSSHGRHDAAPVPREIKPPSPNKHDALAAAVPRASNHNRHAAPTAPAAVPRAVHPSSHSKPDGLEAVNTRPSNQGRHDAPTNPAAVHPSNHNRPTAPAVHPSNHNRPTAPAVHPSNHNMHVTPAGTAEPRGAPRPSNAIAIAQPRPGYAAPIAALNLSQQGPPPARAHPSPTYAPSPQGTPHPLQPPSSPIVPVFAAPKARDSVRFARQPPVIRGQSEETLIPKQNNEFWRRFSMVAKEESAKPYEQRKSPWLKKTQNGTSRLSKWVWFVGLVIFLAIGGAIGLGWYLTHNNQEHQRPTSFGGSKDEASTTTSTSTSTSSSATSSGTSKHVSPTNTVARRAPIPTAFLVRSHVNRLSH